MKGRRFPSNIERIEGEPSAFAKGKKCDSTSTAQNFLDTADLKEHGLDLNGNPIAESSSVCADRINRRCMHDGISPNGVVFLQYSILKNNQSFFLPVTCSGHAIGCCILLPFCVFESRTSTMWDKLAGLHQIAGGCEKWTIPMFGVQLLR
jgi:hypothetical protein